MTDLERRALLGDRKAQEECTEKGIVLPCPFCGMQPKIKKHEFFGSAPCYVISCNCETSGYQFWGIVDRAIRAWNTRTAPPVGRCRTCMWGLPDENPNGPDMFCDQFDKWLLKDDFCSCYEPKEADK